MAKQFEDQGGAASMDPHALVRWATSKVLSRRNDIRWQLGRRAMAESSRRRAGDRHRVEYFHQVEDGYSHLAVQLLRPLVEHYDVELVCHLVTVPRDRNLPEPELLAALGPYDADKVAPHYGLSFPSGAGVPVAQHVDLANRILAQVDPKDFPEVAAAVGGALWSAAGAELETLAARHGTAAPGETRTCLEQGTQRRNTLGHYSSGMFHCAPEWYWGVDRFYHLENRLIEFGARKDPGRDFVCPRPAIDTGPQRDDGSLTLEFYPSLRSPYTSLIFDKTMAFAADVGVKLEIRPVLPMVMRGVQLTRQKGLYIMSDASREAHALGLDWGNMYDPIGQPVRNAYSLYPWAREQGRGTELLSSFVRRAFFEGVNTNNDRGMKHVVEAAGLSWEEARGIMGNSDWEDELEANRLAMYEFGSWGVPSYRLRDKEGNPVLGVWGQDRLWLVAREIQRLLGAA